MPGREEWAMGDQVYQPPLGNDDENPYDVDLDNAIDEPQLDETLDQGYSPPEKPLGATHHGITAAEQRARETLDERLREETADVRPPEGDGIGDQPGMWGEPMDDEVGDARAGRLLRADELAPRRNGNGSSARDVGIDGGAATAEEAAVHVIPDEQLGGEESEAA